MAHDCSTGQEREEEWEEERTEEDIRLAFATIFQKSRISTALKLYFEELRTGPRPRDEETFIQGFRKFAAIAGYRRAEYFETKWSGLFYPHEIEELWSETYPHMSDAAKSENFGWRSPPTWSHKLAQSKCILTYCGTGRLSQGLNELLLGPTALDCGMWTQISLWFAIRYWLGDEFFDQVFDIPEQPFTVVQNWNEPESLLYPFYDILNSRDSRIQTRIMYNHASYLEKHPGGSDRLQNTIQVDNEYFIFHPTATQKSLSWDAIQQMLVAAYNEPRNSADNKMLAMWERNPDYLHPKFPSQSFGDMYEKAFRGSDLRIDIRELVQDQNKRNRLCLGFNLQRLDSYLEKALPSKTKINILKVAAKAQARTLRHQAKCELIPMRKKWVTSLIETEGVLKLWESLGSVLDETGGHSSSAEYAAIKAQQDAMRKLATVFTAKIDEVDSVIAQVNARLARMDGALKPLSTSEQSGDESAEESD